mmetsp:Transcript_28497/g.57953  ORF Transcript_28497/g.57953 Transcript_28497/m.57953 type:complete len:196 (+) Transcript_28497:69-656(+)
MTIKSVNESTNKQTTNKNCKSVSRHSAFLLEKKRKMQGTRTTCSMKTSARKKEANSVTISDPDYSHENKKRHAAEQSDLCNTPVDVEVPLMTQDELVRAKKKCFSTARRLHKIKRRLLLDIAKETEQAETAENENICPRTSSKTRRRNCSRRTRTGSFVPHHQNSDSTMSTFFQSSSSIPTAVDDDDDYDYHSRD